jgi:hypothetical protein
LPATTGCAAAPDWQVNYNGNSQHDVIAFSNPTVFHQNDVVFF